MTDRSHILVVDDDPDTREAMADLLQRDGYSVAAASDGRSALTYLSEDANRRPDLILLDLDMPAMNGFDFRQTQLSSAKHADIPVAVLSAADTSSEQREALRADAFLAKPVTVGSLRAVIREIVGRCRGGE
jgi:CheY-like chemotaxis protein